MGDISFLVLIAIIIVIALVILFPSYYTAAEVKKLTKKSIGITTLWIIWESFYMIILPELFYFLAINRPPIFYAGMAAILILLFFTLYKLLHNKDSEKDKKSIVSIYIFIGVNVAGTILYTVTLI